MGVSSTRAAKFAGLAIALCYKYSNDAEGKGGSSSSNL